MKTLKKFLSFSNKEFEKIVREELKIHSGPISVSDALSIKSLNFAECELSNTDLETLYLFENLEELVFEQDKGTIDFIIFTPFKKLKYLIVGGRLMSDVKLINIGVLKTLRDLEYLSIGDFGEIDLDMIGDVKQLKELCIGWGNNVVGADEIGMLKNLKSLELYDIDLQSLNFINDLDQHTQIDLAGITVEEPFNLENFKKFHHCEYELIKINGELITHLL